MNFKDRLSSYAQATEKALGRRLTFMHKLPYDKTLEAMRYSLLGGGKRIRAVLALEFCRLFSGDYANALPSACAIEMIHAYSLIHDDLPCMDDDDLRRGKPSCHKKHGEAVALLAGDGLLNEAFSLLSDHETVDKLGADRAMTIMREISHASGIHGMIGGQTVDIMGDGIIENEERLREMYALKTGALIRCAAVAGAIAGGADSENLVHVKEYAEHLGLAFQIVDDILDVVGDEETLGKPIGSDADNEKTTFVTLRGLQSAKDYAADITEKAKLALDKLGIDTEFLLALTDYLLKRDY